MNPRDSFFGNETLASMDSMKESDTDFTEFVYKIFDSGVKDLNLYLEDLGVGPRVIGIDRNSLVILDEENISQIKNRKDRNFLCNKATVIYQDQRDNSPKIVLINRSYWDLFPWSFRDSILQSEENIVEEEVVRNEFNQWWVAKHLVMGMLDTIRNQKIPRNFAIAGLDYISSVVLRNIPELGDEFFGLIFDFKGDAFRRCFNKVGLSAIRLLLGDSLLNKDLRPSILKIFRKEMRRKKVKKNE